MALIPFRGHHPIIGIRNKEAKQVSGPCEKKDVLKFERGSWMKKKKKFYPGDVRRPGAYFESFPVQMSSGGNEKMQKWSRTWRWQEKRIRLAFRKKKILDNGT